ncbi:MULTISPECIES: hypothetical protein [Protofrankia]|uniref:Uncharacterized protein n=1 Tax=Candidatus Protofrankia datiscae TaxID=2716812 RepID=F8B1J9_9ACTN|nr:MULTISPECIES: hypothetical protein [Protofrankia]AEH10751.1 hypothetical protein FsymDg_3460 [Candidatus Protofrankia datiscae]
MTTALDFRQALRGAVLRATRPRMAVLSAVHAHPRAGTDSLVGEAPCLAASGDRGFSIDEAEVICWGLCTGCSPHAVADRP